MTVTKAVALILAAIIGFMPHTAIAQNVWDEFIQGADPDLQYGGSASSGRLRGGMNFFPPYNPDRILMRGGFSSGGVCDFNFALNLRQQIEQLIEDAPTLLAIFLFGTAFSFACQSFPSECDIFKHLHQYVNFMLRMQRQSCQQAMAMALGDDKSMRSEGIGGCIDAVLEESGDVDAAMETCLAGTDELPGPNGIRAPEINVIELLLSSTGLADARPDIAETISTRVPNLVFSADGSIFSAEQETEPDESLAQIAANREVLVDMINLNVQDVMLGLEPEPIGIPGEVVPVIVYRAIGSKTPEEQAYEVSKLAGNIAFTEEVLKLQEAAAYVDRAMQVSSLPKAQREKAQQAYDSLLKDIERLRVMRATVEETMAPQYEALLEDQARREAWAASVMQQAKSDEVPSVYMQETGQNDLGYRQ